MQSKDKEIWFPAKRYGWGWGPPCTWQGWVVVAVYAIVIAIGAPMLVRKYSVEAAVAFSIVLSIILALVCWWKGEKPGWRWGDK